MWTREGSLAPRGGRLRAFWRMKNSGGRREGAEVAKKVPARFDNEQKHAKM